MEPEKSNKNLEVATLGGGCFWCLEAVFAELEGVEQVVSGYSGGTVAYPTYQQICTGTTAHAEVVQVTFDPEVLPFPELLDIFFAMHDPTTLNRQGADTGTQYRSVILYHTPEQKASAEAAVRKIESSGVWAGTVVTEITPFQTFYPAENYHQNYYRNNQNQPYCQAVITPKLAKLRNRYLARLRK